VVIPSDSGPDPATHVAPSSAIVVTQLFNTVTKYVLPVTLDGGRVFQPSMERPLQPVRKSVCGCERSGEALELW
jgi:hypothetical protein